MKLTKLLIFLMPILSASCDNDNIINLKDEITVGDYSEMLVNTYDTIISGPYVSELFLDIDRDSINDIKFKCGYQKGLPAGGASKWSEIMSLNKNTLILGFYNTDTLFLNRQTNVDSSSNSDYVIISEQYNHTCNRIDINDIIQKITYDNFEILAKEKGSKIINSDIFKADTITLVEDKSVWVFMSGNNDTIIWTYDWYYHDCQSFPQDEIKYIGLKIINDTDEKLAWIKICIMDIYKILLLESAIQK
jgi:hypothetical protein